MGSGQHILIYKLPVARPNGSQMISQKNVSYVKIVSVSSIGSITVGTVEHLLARSALNTGIMFLGIEMKE